MGWIHLVRLTREKPQGRLRIRLIVKDLKELLHMIITTSSLGCTLDLGLTTQGRHMMMSWEQMRET
jgi:hypothetical protein